MPADPTVVSVCGSHVGQEAWFDCSLIPTSSPSSPRPPVVDLSDTSPMSIAEISPAPRSRSPPCRGTRYVRGLSSGHGPLDISSTDHRRGGAARGNTRAQKSAAGQPPKSAAGQPPKSAAGQPFRPRTTGAKSVRPARAASSNPFTQGSRAEATLEGRCSQSLR